MAISVKAAGSQLTVLSTEHTLLDTTDPGTYALVVNLTPLALGDTVVLRIYGRAAVANTPLAFLQAYSNALGTPLSQSFHIIAPYGAKFTITQTAGSVRTFEWVVVRLDA